MLVLTRKESEAILLVLPDGRKINVMVVAIREGSTDTVRLGIDAPLDVSIWRKELMGDNHGNRKAN